MDKIRYLALKYILPNEEVYFSTVPLVTDKDKFGKRFILQQLRSTDLGLPVSKSDNIKIEVYSYPKEMRYNILNFENLKKYDIKLIGTYNFIVNIENEHEVFGMKKGISTCIIEREHNIKLTFNTIYYKDIDRYILSNPCIEGETSFIK